VIEKSGRGEPPTSWSRAKCLKLGVDDVPVPVERIAKALGAKVRFSPLDDELSGFIFIKGGVPIIGVNSLHHPNRQRFTIAHEIAHLQLHREYITSEVHVDKNFYESILKRDVSSATGTERLEIEANQFAAAMLMPVSVLADRFDESPIDIEDEDSLKEWAAEFGVSKSALQYRIRNL
jgi:Zn-dependent peptidase ImmA (M78 family)